MSTAKSVKLAYQNRVLGSFMLDVDGDVVLGDPLLIDDNAPDEELVIGAFPFNNRVRREHMCGKVSDIKQLNVRLIVVTGGGDHFHMPTFAALLDNDAIRHSTPIFVNLLGGAAEGVVKDLDEMGFQYVCAASNLKWAFADLARSPFQVAATLAAVINVMSLIKHKASGWTTLVSIHTGCAPAKHFKFAKLMGEERVDLLLMGLGFYDPAMPTCSFLRRLLLKKLCIAQETLDLFADSDGTVAASFANVLAPRALAPVRGYAIPFPDVVHYDDSWGFYFLFPSRDFFNVRCTPEELVREFNAAHDGSTKLVSPKPEMMHWYTIV